jgi:hypothetical protein
LNHEHVRSVGVLAPGRVAPGEVQYTVDGEGTFHFRTLSPSALVEPGANGALGWMPLPPLRLAGLLHRT